MASIPGAPGASNKLVTSSLSLPSVRTGVSATEAAAAAAATTTTTITAAAQQPQHQQNVLSRRYRRLLLAIDKALLESRHEVDTAMCIKETYGDDASIFGNSDDTLVTVFDNMIDKVNECVKEETIRMLEREQVPERLFQVEEIMNRLEREQQAKDEADRQDRLATRTALEQKSLLPNSLLPSELVQYQTFQVLQQEKDSLMQELAKVETEIQDLERRCAHVERQVKESVQSMEGFGTEIKQAADACCSSVFEKDD